jgi:hypothetical protein
LAAQGNRNSRRRSLEALRYEETPCTSDLTNP